MSARVRNPLFDFRRAKINQIKNESASADAQFPCALSAFMKNAYQRFSLKSHPKINKKETFPMLFVCYPKCSTCQKAKKWLDAQNKDVTVRDIKLENPTEDELRLWHSKSGLPLKKFFNTSGNLY